MDTDMDKAFNRKRIAVIGIGGAGCNLINRAVKAGFDFENLIAINTDQKHFKFLDNKIKKVGIGDRNETGTGGDIIEGEKAAKKDSALLESIISNFDLIFLCAGIGGGAGGGATPIIAQIAKKFGVHVISIVFLPFRFESGRMKNTGKALDNLKRYSDNTLVLDNNELVRLAPNALVSEAFATLDMLGAKLIDNLVSAITHPNLINLSTYDFKELFGKNKFSTIAIGKGQGKDKIKETIVDLKKNLMLDIDLNSVQNAFVSINGGSETMLGDIIELTEKVTQILPKNINVKMNAKVVGGAYKDYLEIIVFYILETNPIGIVNKGSAKSPLYAIVVK